MTNAYEQIGDDLFAFVSAIDISLVEEGGWGNTFNRPFEPDEVTAGGYPVLMVLPAEDQGSTLDNRGDTDRIVFWVNLIYSVQEVKIDGEAKIRRLADVVRNALKQERLDPSPLGNDAYDLQTSGTWGWDTERGERYYRLVATFNVGQDLI